MRPCNVFFKNAKFVLRCVENNGVMLHDPYKSQLP